MPTTQCHQCQKEIYKRPSHLRLYKKHFCNAICQKEYEKSHNGKIDVACTHCGSQLSRTRQELRRTKNKWYFCNNICKNRFLLSIRWKDCGSVKSHHGLRKKVIEQSKNMCVNCGYKEDIKMLDTHHIDGNHQHNDISNLWSVCVWCHQLHHRCHKPIKNNFGV